MSIEDIDISKEGFADDTALAAAIRPFAENFPLELVYGDSLDDKSGPRSVYELLCRINPDFNQGPWTLDPVQDIIGQAKDYGLISSEARDVYGWWLREAWETKRDEPILQGTRTVTEGMAQVLGLNADIVIRDIQLLWGIRDDVTFDEHEMQSKADQTWTAEHPNLPPRVTPMLRAGYNGFFKQNLNSDNDRGVW